jgi:hypothetical protein
MKQMSQPSAGMGPCQSLFCDLYGQCMNSSLSYCIKIYTKIIELHASQRTILLLQSVTGKYLRKKNNILHII